MIPSIGIVKIGRKRAVSLPLPIFLLWPLLFLGWLLLEVTRLFVSMGSRRAMGLEAAHLGILTLFHLSGLRIDVESADGENVRIRIY